MKPVDIEQEVIEYEKKKKKSELKKSANRRSSVNPGSAPASSLRQSHVSTAQSALAVEEERDSMTGTISPHSTRDAVISKETRKLPFEIKDGMFFGSGKTSVVSGAGTNIAPTASTVASENTSRFNRNMKNLQRGAENRQEGIAGYRVQEEGYQVEFSSRVRKGVCSSSMFRCCSKNEVAWRSIDLVELEMNRERRYLKTLVLVFMFTTLVTLIGLIVIVTIDESIDSDLTQNLADVCSEVAIENTTAPENIFGMCVDDRTTLELCQSNGFRVLKPCSLLGEPICRCSIGIILDMSQISEKEACAGILCPDN